MRVIALLALFCLSGCQTGYFQLMDKAGIPKRQILVNRVQDARDAQIKARYAFSRANDRYQAALHPSGNAPAITAEELAKAYADSDKAAKAVPPRVDIVQHVGDALFSEWKSELGQYRDANLAATSRAEYETSHRQYLALLAQMRTTQQQVQPALDALNDELLFIKHQSNAQAISGLKDSERTIPGNIGPLLIDMQRSIDQAGTFLQRLTPSNQ